MSLAHRIAAGLFALALAGGGTPPLVAAEGGATQSFESTADVNAGSQVDFNLGDGRMLEPLPFDVQFYLRSKIGADVTAVNGRYVGDPQPLLCDDAFARTRNYVDYGYGPRDLVATERRRELPIGLSRFYEADESGQKQRYAELNVVNGLLPNRYYCFEFTRVRRLSEPDKVAEFQQELAEAIEAVYRSADQQLVGMDEIPADVYEKLRYSLIQAVQDRLEPGERLVLPPLSFLDETLQTDALPGQSKRPFDLLAQEQGKRSDQIGNLQNVAAEAACVLAELVASPELAQLKKKAGEDSLSDGLSALLQGADAGLAWADLAQLGGQLRPALQALAEGAQGAPAWSATWEPDDLDVRRRNVTNTLASLAQLEQLTSVLASADSLRTEAGVDELSKLQTLLRCPDDEAAPAAVPVCPGSPPNAPIPACGAIDLLIGVQDSFDIVATALANRTTVLAEVVEGFYKEQVDKLRASGTTTADYEVRVNWYLALDLGIAWAEDIEDFFTYVGTNIYFRPVNKKAHLRWSDFRKGQFRSELFKRLSVTIGISIDDLSRDNQFLPPSQETLTQGLIGNKPLIFATGLRLSDFMRLSVGALVFKDQDPNPLIDETKLAWSPLVSISIDWNFRGTLKNRFGGAPAP